MQTAGGCAGLWEGQRLSPRRGCGRCGSLPGWRCPGEAAARVPPAGHSTVGRGKEGAGEAVGAAAGGTSAPPASALSHAGCAPGERANGRAGAGLDSQLCHCCAPRGESLPAGRALSLRGHPLPLPVPPSWALGAGASPRGPPVQPSCAPPSPQVPPGCTGAGSERDLAPHPAGRAAPQPWSRAQRWGEPLLTQPKSSLGSLA